MFESIYTKYLGKDKKLDSSQYLNLIRAVG